MKKLLAALVAGAFVMAQAPAVFAQDKAAPAKAEEPKPRPPRRRPTPRKDRSRRPTPRPPPRPTQGREGRKPRPTPRPPPPAKDRVKKADAKADAKTAETKPTPRPTRRPPPPRPTPRPPTRRRPTPRSRRQDGQEEEGRLLSSPLRADFRAPQQAKRGGLGRPVFVGASGPRRAPARLSPAGARRPARSSSSSLSVLSMRSRENASISSPFTIWYSPLAVVHGKPYITPSGMP